MRGTMTAPAPDEASLVPAEVQELAVPTPEPKRGLRARLGAYLRSYPSGVPYIVGNEACERFSFYGMRAILWIYLTTLFLNFAPPEAVEPAARAAAQAKATAHVHLFFAGVYAFPMLGALIADRFLGKYRVIMWLSLVYVAGHAVLAFAGHTEQGVNLGLMLIAIGAGGIKPCVSANVGDQFTKKNAHLVGTIFQVFYFTINFGSLFSTLLTPWLYKRYGPPVAFGVPGVLMFIATVVFWFGRNRFVKVAPKPGGETGALEALASSVLFTAFAVWPFGGNMLGAAAKIAVSIACLVVWFVLFRFRQRLQDDSGFLAILIYAFRNQGQRRPGMGFFDVARAKYGDEAADGPAAVLRIMVVFSMVSVFWALFDQHSTSWINQASQMGRDIELPIFGQLHLEASQLAALNPAMVMILIPLLHIGVFPLIQRAGLKLTTLRKMSTGMFLAALSFVAVALIQSQIDTGVASGEKVPVLWQIVPYLVITTAEILVSATGLEFAYTQAPRTMKSTIMGFWFLCITAGNLLVAFLAGFEKLALVNFFWTFAGLMALAALLFSVLAYFYKERTYLQS